MRKGSSRAPEGGARPVKEQPAHDEKNVAQDALTWYRQAVCGAEAHTHGPDGEMDCLLSRWTKVKGVAG